MNYTFRFNEASLAADNVLSFSFSYLGVSREVIGEFTESFHMPREINIDMADETTLRIIKNLHIIVGISYYKSLLGAVETTYDISPTEANYYNAIYDKGLGEYKYINKLIDVITPFSANTADEPRAASLQTDGALLGIGGGKDSIVAGELFKKLGIELQTLDMATRDNHGQAGAVMDVMDLPQLHVGRYLDASIVAFTEKHSGMNGHVPLSTIIAWVGVLIAYSTGKKYVAMANEGATSTGNTVWNGNEVNHQWAKSLEHERLTQNFIASTITPDIQYLSPIRPYGSLVIMELLAKLGAPYLHDFTSCNLVLRIDPAARPNGRWCTRCAKCLSTWLLLSYWMSTEQLVEIFGRNLWDDTSLQPVLKSLLGLEGHKPLDCVGTIEELRAVTRKVLVGNYDYPLLSGINKEDILGVSIEELISERFEHNLPEKLSQDLESVVTELL